LSVSGAGFSLVPSTLTSLGIDAGQHQDVTVRFTPSSGSQGSGTLTLNSNDPCQPVRTVALTGAVISPEITVAVESSLFPPTVVGCSESKTITLTNTGGAALVVSPSISGAGYSLSPFLGSGLDGIHLLPGASTQLTINFAPTSVASVFPGRLSLTSNDPTNPTTALDFC